MMVSMDRLSATESEQAVEWLRQTGQTSGFMTGFNPGGWPAQVWLLHAMYQNAALIGPQTHHDARRSVIDRGAVEPLMIGGVDLDAASTVSGVPLGYVARPNEPWIRLRWSEYLDQIGGSLQSPHDVPPSIRWFPRGSWAQSVSPPPEGSLDEVTWYTLIDVLSEASPLGQQCFAFYGSLPSRDFEAVEVWRGSVGSLATFIDSSLHDFTPTNVWAADRGSSIPITTSLRPRSAAHTS
ncbi:hypothetical protein ABLG96_03310 [Nakamurella sp. A5-74]|uniref:Uncharacterized protein n=1 Tax=Nakamurella sp. A5-74 TaxID=3158264 RepID=A0AAU8DSD8_9ACTN